ncbi:MAG: hypothetical protein Q4G63_00640 [Bacteroidia bacterium]|nr:hypothetical protein [Bacteroidia bacterium]
MAIFSACKKSELLDVSDSNNLNTMTVKDDKVDILSFNNEQEFNNLVESIRNNEATENAYSRTRSTAKNFKSIFDEYNEAMRVADEYYQREGGYEEFKKMFPNLYYPEHGEDYAAFLPVSDEAVAKLLNKEGKVIINGKERDLRDIFSYDKLQELGLALPSQSEIASTRFISTSPVINPEVAYNVVLTTSKVRYNNRRRMWVTIRGIEKELHNLPYAKVKEARIDFC